MKKFATLLVTLLVIASMTLCAAAEDKPFAGQTLTVSTFSFNAELMQKNIYQPFMEQTGATVVIDSGRNAERVTKITEAPENYDVVVIGAGIAGCTAAQAAAEAGASVCALEKFEGPTGHGTDIGAIGSKLQTEQGAGIDRALATRLIYQWSQSEANYYVIKNYVYRSGEVMDHYLDMAEDAGGCLQAC